MFTVPVGDWFRHELHGWLRETLTGNEVVNHLFEPKEVLRLLDQHRDGSANFTRELRALAALAIWETTC
jgi:asparagine synthase (glutamine-hydrolysing)